MSQPENTAQEAPASTQVTVSQEDKIRDRINPDITLSLGTADGGSFDFNNASQMMEFAKLMALADVAIPKHLRKNPGACLAICIQASAWRMDPFAVANKSYSVNDRLAYEAQLVNAVILRRAPIRGRFDVSYSGEKDTRRCKVSVELKGGGFKEYESPAIGTISTKNSPLWKGDPDQQLFYYSSRAMCRRHFPDVLLGVYTPDELAELDVTEPRKLDFPEPAPQKAVIEAEQTTEA